jgi:tripartite-type tricarboxylate transporter receptor subunit TctC
MQQCCFQTRPIPANVALFKLGHRLTSLTRRRALAVTSPTRYPLLPDAPTVAETLPGVQYMSWLGMATAPHTPRPIVDRLNAELHHALALPDVNARLKEGGNIATPTTPEQMRQQITDEIAAWKELIEANHIKMQ